MSADIDFDHHSDEANADPVAYYARFRETCPVGHSAAYDGFHYTTRYADVARIARDDETFSSARSDHGGRGSASSSPKDRGWSSIRSSSTRRVRRSTGN